MELKTWPAKTDVPRLRARTDTSGGNDQIKHAHAGSRRRDVSEPLAQKVSGSWVHTEPGLWTVKLGRGVKVEESNKHEVGAENGKFPRPNCTLSNLIKETKLFANRSVGGLEALTQVWVFIFCVVFFVLFLQPHLKCQKKKTHQHLIVRMNIFPGF